MNESHASVHDITALIEAGRRDPAARERLFERVYGELHRIARRARHAGRDGDTMQPTVLVNEAFLLFERNFPLPPKDQTESRETFYRTVAQAMRLILRDTWRQKQAAKRGGSRNVVALGDHDPGEQAQSLDGADFLALDAALNGLEAYNRRWFDVVMHRFFAGRSLEETAELLGVGLTTVKGDWKLARAWLRREVAGGEDA